MLVVAGSATGPAMALGFGEVRANVVLGQPLSLAVPVTLGEGESLTNDCVNAEVTSGDSRLPPSTVRVRVTQGRDNTEAVIRISSSTVIDEPIVNVTLGAGCPTRVSRSLVLLADPPLVNTTTATAPEVAPPAAAAPVRTPSAEASAVAPAPTAPRMAVAPRATRPAAPPRAAARTATPREVPATTVAPPPRPAPRVAAAPRPAPKAAAERAESRPRLELESPQVSLSQAAAVQAAEAQASAARGAAAVAEAAAASATQRLKDLESDIAKARADVKAQTDALLQLRQQMTMEQSQRAQPSWLMPFLLAAVGLLTLVAGWLAWRVSQQRAEPQRDAWWDKARAMPPRPSIQEDEDSGYQSSSFKPSTRQPQLKMPAPAPAPRVAAEPSYPMGLDSMIAPPTVPAPTPVTIPPLSLMDEENRRAVSVDEQIDLEQQADFFIALGHDESAIDLLMAHLRSTGGGTPLPFLKLLEIHRRRGDREAYERTRVRFNQRFNSVAPDWTSDPGAGRSLEGYPLVVGRVQHAWGRPLDAMAELESLLFRRGAGSEMFDLPAYQEVLFLYQLARDLHQADQPHDAPDTSVDVLLPIGAMSEAVPEGTIMLRPEFNSGEAMRLDLDLGLDTQAGTIEEAKANVATDLSLDLDSEFGKKSADKKGE